MRNAQRFNFTEGFDGFGVPDALPQLPISLTYQDRSVEFSALLDTGASVNVLPYSAGVQLGAIWEEQTTSVILAGNLASIEARGLLVRHRLVISTQFGWFLLGACLMIHLYYWVG